MILASAGGAGGAFLVFGIATDRRGVDDDQCNTFALQT
jgi:hypothetical protein